MISLVEKENSGNGIACQTRLWLSRCSEIALIFKISTILPANVRKQIGEQDVKLHFFRECEISNIKNSGIPQKGNATRVEILTKISVIFQPTLRSLFLKKF